MAITTTWFGLGLLDLLDTPRDMEALTLKLGLVTASYTPNVDTDQFWSTPQANEVANGNGYATGGVTVTGAVWSYDATSDQVRLDIADPSWTFTASKTWRYGVLYAVLGGASTADPVIALLTWDSNQTVSTAYTLTIDSTGLLYIDTT